MIAVVTVLGPAGFGIAGRGAANAGQAVQIWLTGYSWQDDTPPNSGTISHPILHKQAGGTGTYGEQQDGHIPTPATTRYRSAAELLTATPPKHNTPTS